MGPVSGYFRKLPGISIALFLPLLVACAIASISQAQAQDKGKTTKRIVVELTSPKQLKALKEALKDVDEGAYRVTVQQLDRGKVKTSRFGSLPVDQARLAHKQVVSIHQNKI